MHYSIHCAEVISIDSVNAALFAVRGPVCFVSFIS